MAVAAALILTHLAPRAWLALPFEGLLAVLVAAAAAGWGGWPTVWLGFARRTTTQQVLLAITLGLGVLGTLTLVLGVAGGLTRPVAWTLIGIGGALGIARLARPGSAAPTAQNDEPRMRPLVAALVLLTLAIPLAILLFGASIPPGILWLEENKAYDVLEYHLQGPREYYEAGRIQFLPHNVYASFPQQMEVLYLLLMHLGGGPLAGAVPAQFLHAICAILAVVALAAWSPPGWPRSLAAIAGGSVPWLAYLGCLAYVECGMLLFAAVAGGLALDRVRDDSRGDWRIWLAPGLCAGLAAGCKYTAFVFVTAALALALLVTLRGALAQRLKRVGIFAIGAIIAFSPWLIRNAAFTGNPVYPFGWSQFGGAAWSAEQDRQWARGHQLHGEDAALGHRLETTRVEFLLSPMFGPTLLLLAVGGLALRRDRAAAMPALWSLLILLGWITLTAMPGRFLIPVVVPLVMLAARTVENRRDRVAQRGSITRQRRLARAVFLIVAVLGAAANGSTLAGRVQENDAFWAKFGASLRDFTGQIELVQEVEPLNQLLPPDATAWLVGDARVFYLKPRIHYTVAFNRDPWLAHAATATPRQAVDWLRTQNVSHVVFSWHEIDRLRDTYGFSPLVTRAWVRQLQTAGLRRVAPTAPASVGKIEVYEVLPPHTPDTPARARPGDDG